MFLAKVFTNLLLQLDYVCFCKASIETHRATLRYDIILSAEAFVVDRDRIVPLTLPFKFLLLTLFSALAGAAVRDRKKIEEALREATFIFLVMVVIGAVSIQLV